MSAQGAIAPKNDHLFLHRRLILLRSIASGLVGMTPVPYLNDWAATVIRRNTIRRIADARRVDLDEPAVRAIAEGVVAPPGWQSLLTATPLVRFARRTWRNALLMFSLYRRAEEASRSFAAMTLFDHYCARLHIGGELDAAAGKALRARIDRAIAASPRGAGTALFRRGLAAAGRATLRAPFEIVDSISGGLLRRRLARHVDERGEEVTDAEEVIEAEVRRESSDEFFLSRAARAVDRELAQAGRAFLDDLIARFEEGPKK